jgi:hypothetical protein
MDAAFKWLMLFSASQLALIALSGLPLKYWKSFLNQPPSEPPVSGMSGTEKPTAAVS